MTPSYPLLVDTALYSLGSTLNAVVLAGTLTDSSSRRGWRPLPLEGPSATGK
jgi:hypothetical protein